MRAIAVDEYGEMPMLMQLPDPRPEAGQLLIKVEAAGMNPMDRFIADGGFQAMGPAQFPLILGSDVAGVVEAIGEGTSRFSPGDEVFGQLLITPFGSAGTFAELVAVSENAPLASVPSGLDLAVAAALPTPGVTALGIVEALEPLAGKTVLIVGAAGGVGSFATQLAANGGADVIAVARSDTHDRLRNYGAAETIDYRAESVSDAVQKSYPNGIEVLIDLANAPDVFAELASLVRPGGSAFSTREAAVTEDLAARGINGVNYRVEMSNESLERLVDEVVNGRIVTPPIGTIDLVDVPGYYSAPAVKGKTVIEFSQKASAS